MRLSSPSSPPHPPPFPFFSTSSSPSFFSSYDFNCVTVVPPPPIYHHRRHNSSYSSSFSFFLLLLFFLSFSHSSPLKIPKTSHEICKNEFQIIIFILKYILIYRPILMMNFFDKFVIEKNYLLII